MNPVVLASKSPRRREILTALDIPFRVVAPQVEELPCPGETPCAMALRLAGEKALAVSRTEPGSLCIGADTVVDVDGAMFGKPRDRQDAYRMLRTLSGRSHDVHTGIAIAKDGRLLARETETTKVMFASLSESEITAFSDSGIGDDKAGAYAIQERGALLVERIEGCYYNVVGLPAYRLHTMLKALEIDAI